MLLSNASKCMNNLENNTKDILKNGFLNTGPELFDDLLVKMHHLDAPFARAWHVHFVFEVSSSLSSIHITEIVHALYMTMNHKKKEQKVHTGNAVPQLKHKSMQTMSYS